VHKGRSKKVIVANIEINDNLQMQTQLFISLAPQLDNEEEAGQFTKRTTPLKVINIDKQL
jgi:hypothetical protein